MPTLFDALISNAGMFQVNYRISEKEAANGNGEIKTSDRRYDELTAHLKVKAIASRSQFVDPGHVSTSTWIVKHDYSGQDLYDELVQVIALGFDTLRVVPIQFGQPIDSPEPVKA